MNKKQLPFLLILVLTAVQANQVFELSDYAWQSKLETSDASLQRIDLTLEILQGMSHAGAADIAVFDVNGQSLPAKLNVKNAVHEAGQVDLNFHRFNREQVTGMGGTLTIDQQQLDEESRQINRLEYQQRLAITQQRSDYIIELSDEQKALGITEIELEWTHQPASDFLKLTVQAANDLDHWTTLQTDKNLFRENESKTEWFTLTRLPVNYRYIRLVPHQDIDEFTLIKATGTYHKMISAPDIQFNTDKALAEDAQHAGYYHFKQPLNVNAKSLSFVLPKGYFVSGTLYASNRGFDKKFTVKSNFRQYNMSQVGNNENLDISSHRYTDWWFKPDKNLSVPISLNFSYPAYQLYFINNQQGPLTLAWGNYEVSAVSDNLTPLLQNEGAADLTTALTVNYTQVEAAGGEQRQHRAEVTPWKTWLLWGLLLIAVLVTARMALTLYRDMNSPAS